MAGSQAYHLAGLHVVHAFGDVDTVIGGTFQILRGEKQVHTGPCVLRILFDVGNQMVALPMEQVVYRVIRLYHPLDALQIMVDKGAHGISQKRTRQVREGGKVYERTEKRVLGEAPPNLRDVYRVVADTLDIGDDLHRAANKPQIACNRRLQGNQPNAIRLNLNFELIYEVIRTDYLRGELDVLLHDSRYGVRQHGIHTHAHVQQALPELLQPYVKLCPRHCHLSPALRCSNVLLYK